MADRTFTIPSPVLVGGATFSWVLKNSAGATVDSGTATNAPFTITGIPDGDNYILYTEFDVNTNGWCFTTPSCVCPVPSTAEIIQSAPGLRYAVLTFDMSEGFCPFRIHVTHGSGSSSVTYPVYILSLGDFDSNVGDVYTKKIFIGSSTFFTWQTYLNSAPGTSCIGSQTITYECDGPILSNIGFPSGATGHAYLVPTDVDYEEWDLRIKVFQCGSTCNEFTVDYLQTNSLTTGAPDMGSYTAAADCSMNPLSTNNDQTLAPNMNIVGFTGSSGSVFPIYNITYTDCCGATFTATVKILAQM